MVEPVAHRIVDLVGNTQSAKGFVERMIAMAQLQLLGAFQPGEEIHQLARREQAVVEGVGEEHRWLVGVDLVDAGPGAALRRHRQQRIHRALVVADQYIAIDGRQFRSRAAGGQAGCHQQGDALRAGGVVAVQRSLQIGPATQRRHGLDAWIARRRQQAGACAVGDARNADPGRIGAGVVQRPINQGADIFDRGWPCDVDAAAGLPETPRAVTDHHIAAPRQRLRHPHILHTGYRPAAGHHQQRIAPAARVLRFDDEGPERRSIPAGNGPVAGLDRGGPSGGRQSGQQDQQQQYLAHRRLSPSVVVQRVGPYQCEW